MLDGRAHGVFNGAVVVRPDAQKTDAQPAQPQPAAVGRRHGRHASPQLEIYADDVKCSHGATIGRLDEDALFYLRSRGIGAARRGAMLAAAFAGEVVDAHRRTPALRAELDAVRSASAWQRLGTEVA